MGTRFQITGKVQIETEQPLSAVRIRFHAITTDDVATYVGETTTSPTGQYTFAFLLEKSEKVALRAHLLQFVDEVWTELPYKAGDVPLTSPTTQHDYVVAIEEVLNRPTREIRPPQDDHFLFGQMGLIPIDSQHLRNGLATYKEGTFQVTDQPLGGVLRITGMFANFPSVKKYRVEITTTQNQADPLWRPILDPLTNLRWNDMENRWIQQCLGPDKEGLYENVDTAAEQWAEPRLKVCWKSTGVPDGTYVLRITGYSESSNTVAQAMTPPIRLSNTAPTLKLETDSSDQNCGTVSLEADRILHFLVSISHPYGDVCQPTLTGTRGPKPEPAGNLVRPILLPPPGPKWPGWDRHPVDFLVATSTCPTMAYGFQFVVKRTATDGRSNYLASSLTTTNLMITLPKP